MSLQEAFGIPYALQKALEKDLEKVIEEEKLKKN